MHYSFFNYTLNGSCRCRSVTENHYQTDYFVQMLHALCFLYYKYNPEVSGNFCLTLCLRAMIVPMMQTPAISAGSLASGLTNRADGCIPTALGAELKFACASSHSTGGKV